MTTGASGVAVVALLLFAAIGSRALRYTAYVRITGIVVVAILAIAVGAPNLGVPPLVASVACAVIAVAALLFAIGARVRVVPSVRRWLADAEADPLILAPPFKGSWRAVAGGPHSGRNHHLIASDQRFAYDFVKNGSASLGEWIMAPTAGLVVAARDGKPDHPSSLRVTRDREALGNHVAIDSGRGVVFLCHLQNGSLNVREGDRVAPGDAIGRCGNSGRTTRPHLHVHAQDLSVYAYDRAKGIPIAFITEGTARVLRAGEILASSSAADLREDRLDRRDGRQ